MTRPRRILVTGGTGFIGRALLERLLNDGYDVLAIKGRRGPDLWHERLEWRSLDLLRASVTELRRALLGRDITHCMHTAWYTNHSDYLVADVNKAWLEGSLRLADAFGEAGGRRFVGVGTCSEYRPPADGGPCVEDQTPLVAETHYARCKAELFRVLRERGGDFAWARIFFVYGPGDRAGRLVPHVLAKFAAGEEAGPTYGGLRRDYIHVDDLVGQLARIAASDVRGAVNTGTGEAVSIADVFRIAAELFGQPELARLNDTIPENQPAVIEASLTKLRGAVGEPEVRTLKSGLRPLVEERK